MPPFQRMEPIQTNSNHRRDILLLIFCSIAILMLLVRSATLAATGLLNFDPQNSPGLAASLLGALAMLFCAGLLLPALFYTLKQMGEQVVLPAVIQPVRFWQMATLVAAWGLVIIIGAWLAGLFTYGWILAAPLFLLGVSLPILSLVWIGAGGLPVGSRRRMWCVFGYGLVGSTVAALLLELLVVGIASAGIGFLASANPELRSMLDQIKTLVTTSNAGDMQALLTTLTPTIANPLVIVSILVFAAGVAPLIEEAVKPAVIGLLGKRLRSPAEGFVLGMLCGAGFAMMEGLLATSSTTQMWGFGLVGRAAASLMHITASGLMGWAIASAQLEKRFRRLVLIYLLSFSIHGIWNGSAILAVYGGLRMMVQNMQVDFPGVLFTLGGLGMLVFELFVLLAALLLVNLRLRPPMASKPADAQSDIIAALTS